jgi:type VI secretion system protein VasL
LRLNGAELQTVSFYTLACSQRYGLAGMTQGVNLLKTLSGQWSSLWPPATPARLDILGWLFAQLQPLLRSLSLTTYDVPALLELDNALAGVELGCTRHTGLPLMTLQALRQQVSSLIQRLEQGYSPDHIAMLPVRAPEPLSVRPVVILPPPGLARSNRRLAPSLCAAMVLLALGAGFAWHTWWVNAEKHGALPDPVHLDSLWLFEAGSAVLTPGSTAELVKALVDIKAQPGWLIIISGHTDATGSAEQNLQLSHARASAVRDWMQRVGNIAAECFAVQGFAANQPIAGNDNETGRMTNRRVDIRLLPQAQACEQTREPS